MPHGPGKYDAACTQARESTKATAVLLIVFNGEHGNGFSLQGDLLTLVNVPEILENVAADIRAEREEMIRNVRR
jgi:hypothetical protein